MTAKYDLQSADERIQIVKKILVTPVAKDSIENTMFILFAVSPVESSSKMERDFAYMYESLKVPAFSNHDRYVE